jgi:polyhydroxybutyrate depolymerase
MILRGPFRRWSPVRTRAASILAIGAVVAFAAGVDPPPAAGAGSMARGTLRSDGMTRTYRLYVPASLDRSRPAPLVLVLHGHGGTGEQVARSSGFDAEADRGRFIVAYPDGVDRGWHDADLDRLPDVDDVAFVRDLIADVASRFDVDPTRVYVAGMSNGGFMAERVACDLPDVVAAIGAVAASRRAPCDAERPVSVMHVHGMRDRLVRYGGSTGGAIGAYPSQPALAGSWRTTDDCTGAPVVETTGVLRRETAVACRAGTAVVSVAIRTAGHEWPGGAGARTPARTFDTTHELWLFFAAHPRR